MKKIFKIIGKVLLIAILLFIALMSKSIFASSLEDSVIVTGTKNLADAIIRMANRNWNYSMWRLLYLLCVFKVGFIIICLNHNILYFSSQL